jgi:hypothetical protein
MANPKVLKKLPKAGEDFSTIEEKNLLYVDKTVYIYKLALR